ncbi:MULTISPECIES: GNAT family N-acetyltransferase [Kitasatospora]|uniref:Putative acetyltransferase n=1 Tax=Kitasatospora setae (strain ATCC 33774 / DSM 43861 / JCM 3304 / KCC A-0304 / NBRC 14216 / KM-6054) TaxID=452652 RepID=E4N4D9_KITSK|nr:MULTISPECIES: GNAT family N-acetyltransferase [Kitasatospora]BAJ26070.1 putative acetyltransferase [Kitasatospora setae KM-6054]
MRIREARIGELPLLQEIERAAGHRFREVGMELIADDEPLSVEELTPFVTAGLAWVSVDDAADGDAAEHGADRPVAYLIAARIDGALHVEQVSVHPSYARRGVGRALLEHLAGVAAAEGVGALTLTTFTEVPWNAPYYARCGFRPVPEADLGPGLREVRAHEAALGLDRWPRLAMRRAL